MANDKATLRTQLANATRGRAVTQVPKGRKSVPTGDWKYLVRGLEVGIEVRN
jgi:hypothetical protein